MDISAKNVIEATVAFALPSTSQGKALEMTFEASLVEMSPGSAFSRSVDAHRTFIFLRGEEGFTVWSSRKNEPVVANFQKICKETTDWSLFCGIEILNLEGDLFRAFVDSYGKNSLSHKFHKFLTQRSTHYVDLTLEEGQLKGITRV